MTRSPLVLVSLGIALETAAIGLFASGHGSALGVALMVIGLAAQVIGLVTGRRRP